jgi:hypothetical protein
LAWGINATLILRCRKIYGFVNLERKLDWNEIWKRRARPNMLTFSNNKKTGLETVWNQFGHVECLVVWVFGAKHKSWQPSILRWFWSSKHSNIWTFGQKKKQQPPNDIVHVVMQMFK